MQRTCRRKTLKESACSATSVRAVFTATIAAAGKINGLSNIILPNVYQICALLWRFKAEGARHEACQHMAPPRLQSAFQKANGIVAAQARRHWAANEHGKTPKTAQNTTAAGKTDVGGQRGRTSHSQHGRSPQESTPETTHGHQPIVFKKFLQLSICSCVFLLDQLRIQMHTRTHAHTRTQQGQA